MDSSHNLNSGYGGELESFQRKVSEQFTELSSSAVGGSGPDELLSLPWLRNLLDVFICCQEEFRMILFNNRSHLSRPPMDRLIGELYDRSVKALDVCNAIGDGIEQIRHWQKLLEIVLCALDSTNSTIADNRKCIGEGQVMRAKKAMIDLAIGMMTDEKESISALVHRNQSFGRNDGSSGGRKKSKNLCHFRSLSWSVSRSWSASKQIQAIGSNLSAPKANEISATNGLAVSVYTISCVLWLVMWTMVAAIPCQDRGSLQAHISIPRQFPWAASIISIHQRVMEESKRRERRNACGLLREIYQIENWTKQLNEVLGSVKFPLAEEKADEVIRSKVKELWQVFESLREGLEPLECQVREVFHRIVRSRNEGLESLE